MKKIKILQCFAVLVLSSLVTCSFSGCNKDKDKVKKTDPTTTEEETESTEDDDDWDDEDWEEDDVDLEDILDNSGLSISDTDNGIEIQGDDGTWIIIETEGSTDSNNLGPYVYDGDFEHTDLDGFAQECSKNGWPIEVLSASDLGLTDDEFKEGFVAYDINEYPHYYIYYKDHDTAYSNLVDHILGDDADISHVANINEPDTYSVDFDNDEHAMDVEIFKNGLAIFDDHKVTVYSYDRNSDSYPANKDYDTPEINDLAKEYDDKKFSLIDIAKAPVSFPNAVEGFMGTGCSWDEATDVVEGYEVYVIKFDSVDDALSDLKKVFGKDFSDLANKPDIILEFESHFTDYTGSLSDDGLLVLKGVEQ
ncbi:MAG: hypothetical protein J5776_04070 [Clostridiales bacterium]|nr:hypothetical protein [Clostridiales bacterium]